MFYRDLIQFEPIESIIQLREANDAGRAADLVRTYVISDRMTDVLANVVIPQLSLDQPVDHKGILVVGNYGTGKSHLMSVLSAVAEYPSLVDSIGNDAVRAAAGAITGRFKVVRVELGGVSRSLRDNLLDELQRALASWGTPYAFPAASELTNHKDVLIQAVAGFQQHYPDQGILMVVDELLDFLRGRSDRELILDLSFLRELGEVAALTSFRFMGGVQETLFDNPRFLFVSDQLRRVKDRFVQLTIVREDIAFVVSQRLLRKDDAQIARITEHLRRFAPLYPELAERLPDFARLFPIHPAYIDMFDQLFIAEKRQALVTFRDAVQAMLDRPLPEDEPGLLSYDHYWSRILDDPSLRTAAGVSEVVDKSGVLEAKIRNAYTRPNLRPVALRLIRALSVRRLMTDDIYVPLGVTAAELRDDLLPHLPLPEQSADFLLDQVEIALREIMHTVSGQYISHNVENGQYYLDIKKDIDFDARIHDRGEAMDDNELNRYFFDALRQVLGLSTTTYLSGHSIWPYELPWAPKQVTRPGYFFFGLPDERGTAQPPRDFYVYFVPPFGRRTAVDVEPRQDEVLLALSQLDSGFTDLLRLYAGARALANESPGYRDTYQDKATGRGGTLGRLTAWLNENLSTRLQVTYEGETQTLRQALAGAHSTAGPTVDDLIKLLAAHLLEPHFAEAYPDYPAFTKMRTEVTEGGRPAVAREAINAIVRGTRTVLGTAALEGLGLLDDDDALRPHRSLYARRYLEILQAKPENQVVNRGELIQVVGNGQIGLLEKDIPFRLEPEWAAVVLLALVQNGDIVLTVDGKEALDAGNVERAAIINIADLAGFRHYARTRGVPVERWARIYDAFGLSPGLVRDETQRERGIGQFQDAAGRESRRVAELRGKLGYSLQLWNQPLFTDPTLITQGGVVESAIREAVSLPHNHFDPQLRRYDTALEKLARYNTTGKLRNLDLGDDEIDDLMADRAVVDRLAAVLDLVTALSPMTGYLAQAEAVMPADHPWPVRAAAEREAILLEVRRMARGDTAVNRSAPAQRLEALKRDYRAAYAELHRASVLGPAERERKARLAADPRLAALRTLAGVDLLRENEPTLNWWIGRLDGLRVCAEFHDGLLESRPLCVCGFRPDRDTASQSPVAALDDLDGRLDGLLSGWQTALRAALAGESVQESLRGMTPAERAPIEQFLAPAGDDPTLPAGFVESVNRALRGIRTLALDSGALLDALREGGLPCTFDELLERFGHFAGKAMYGHDRAATRLTLSERLETGD